MLETQSSLLPFQDEGPPKTLSKTGFAEHVGVTPGRVSQMITMGLPVEPSGRIRVANGLAWMDANIDANRRRAGTGGTGCPGSLVPPVPLTSRSARDQAEAEISRLKADRLASRLIDRRTTLRLVEGRAKFERDALIGWVNRAAPLIAAETGADLSKVTAILDREIRAHLLSMAEKPLELPK
jgi:hypothetical protein